MIRKRRNGFTLIELLVVITITGIVMAMLLPAVQAAREAGLRAQCKNNLKQIGLALLVYHDVHRCFPMGAHVHQPTNPPPPYRPHALHEQGWGWGAHILPYIEQTPLHNKIDFRSTDLNAGGRLFGGGALAYNGNLDLAKTTIPLYVCPSDIYPDRPVFYGTGGGPRRIELGHTNYVGVADSYNSLRNSPRPDPDFTYTGNGMLFNVSSVRFADVRDGTSNTLFIGEGTGDPDGTGLHFNWATGSLVHARFGINGWGSLPGGGPYRYAFLKPGASFSSYHPGGANFLMVDGSVRFIPETVDQQVLEALATRAGREVTGNSQF